MTIIPCSSIRPPRRADDPPPLLDRGDIASSDAVGRTVITLAVDDWLLEQLLTFDAGSEDLEDNGAADPDDDAEEDGPPY
jgi:hypothetical protein